MDTLKAFLSQQYPPKPTFTERELQDLSGKVLLITGGYSGVGYQLANIVYGKNATVYIAGRRQIEGLRAIDEIYKSHPNSTGRLEFLELDLADLNSVKKSAEEFLSRESRLDVLWNNAGVMLVPVEKKTVQGYDMSFGTNCIGPFLFTRLLHPLLVSTAASSSETNTVRVLWAGSFVIHLQSPNTGLDIENLDYKNNEGPSIRYAVSKVGNLFIGTEWAKRDKINKIIHLTFNPGNLKTSLQRYMSSLQYRLTSIILHDSIYGAYTELWAGLSPSVMLEDTGRYVIPWGRFGPIRHDILPSLKSRKEGGTGKAQQFFEYCEIQTNTYM